MLPAYRESATTLKEKGSRTKLAKVDCAVHPGICERNGINSYPTLKLFRRPLTYPGLRTADAITQYAFKAVGESEKVRNHCSNIFFGVCFVSCIVFACRLFSHSFTFVVLSIAFLVMFYL